MSSPMNCLDTRVRNTDFLSDCLRLAIPMISDELPVSTKSGVA